MTNADRIRAMSDEELALWICRQVNSCGSCRYADLCDKYGEEANGAIKWLQQPAEEEKK